MLQKTSIVFLLVVSISTVFVLPSRAFGVSDFVLVQQYSDSTGLSDPVITSMDVGATYRLYHDYNTVSCFVYCITDTGLDPQYGYLQNYPVPFNTPLRYDFTITIYSNVANDLSEYYELSLRLKDNTGAYLYPIDSSCPYYDKIFIEQGWTYKDDTDGFYMRFAGVYDFSQHSLLETRIGLYLEPYLDRSESYDIYITFNEWSVGDYSISQGNLSVVESGQAQVDQAISNISKVQGVGHQPSVNLKSIYSSGDFNDFLRNADELYSLPIISSMIGITCTFSVLFFLLKKR